MPILPPSWILCQVSSAHSSLLSSSLQLYCMVWHVQFLKYLQLHNMLCILHSGCRCVNSMWSCHLCRMPCASHAFPSVAHQLCVAISAQSYPSCDEYSLADITPAAYKLLNCMIILHKLHCHPIRKNGEQIQTLCLCLLCWFHCWYFSMTLILQIILSYWLSWSRPVIMPIHTLSLSSPLLLSCSLSINSASSLSWPVSSVEGLLWHWCFLFCWCFFEVLATPSSPSSSSDPQSLVLSEWVFCFCQNWFLQQTPTGVEVSAKGCWQQVEEMWRCCRLGFSVCAVPLWYLCPHISED